MAKRHCERSEAMKTIPEQRKGAGSVTRYSVKTKDQSAAIQLFRIARENLLHVNSWHQLAGSSSAVFRVVDDSGKETSKCVEKGNYLRISIPMIPGSAPGGGDDWVKVEKIDEQEGTGYQFIAIRVRPAVPPFNKEGEVAHFFAADATSTFCIERKGNKVTAAVYGRNEKPNIGTSRVLTWLRNMIVALGAMIGLNKPQWKNLVKGLVNKRL